jgi:hypothetical protein
MSNGLSTTGVASVIVAMTTRMFGSQPPPVIKVSTSDSFLTPDWNVDEIDDKPQCTFYNATFQYTGALCSHFAMARMSRATQVEALNRALSCAAYYQTDCVLSPEIGLSVPAAFVYDQENGLTMAIAPKIISFQEGYGSSRKIALNDPNTGNTIGQVDMKAEVEAEFLEGVTRVMHRRVFNGSAAYCVQLLRAAIDEPCWDEID